MNAILRCENVTIKRQAQLICESLNLSFCAGERWAILGPNGCGKSTFLHVIAHLYSPTSGSLLLQDKKITEWPSRERARMIGLLLQEMEHTFAQTVWEVCLTSRYPHQSYWQRTSEEDLHLVQAALSLVNLSSLAKRKCTELSGGEKRRLAIAALLAQHPQIYLLDEPFNHLDVLHQIQLLQHLHQLSAQQKIILLSTHDVNLANHFATHVLLMFPQGKIKAGKKEDILTAAHLSKLYHRPFIWQANRFDWLL
jgi:iron complex transport system ATP-binding protein